MAVPLKIQSKSNTSASSPCSAVFDALPKEGNLLVATVYSSLQKAVTSMAGWQIAVQVDDDSAHSASIFYKIAKAGESATVTAVSTGSGSIHLIIAEYSGIDITQPFDKSAYTGGVANVNSLAVGPTATTSQPDELVIVMAGIAGSGTVPTYTNSFTNLANTTRNFTGEKIVSSAAAYSSTIGFTGTAVRMNAVMATFRAARKSLTIAGANFLQQYKTDSVRIRELVQNKSGVMNMEITVKSGQTTPQQGSEIIFKDATRYLFGGYVTRISPVEIGKGNLFVYTVEASDYSFILNNKVAKRAYTDQTLAFIVADLMATYVDSTYGFNLTNVETGPLITSIIFDHISIRKCFEKLSKLTGLIWYVDYQKKLYFTSILSTPAPEAIRDSGTNYSEVNVSYDTSQVRNKVIVIGSDAGEAANATTINQFTADGISRIWALDDIPTSVAYIKVDGVTKNFHVSTEQIASDYAVYYTDSLYIRLAESATTPTAGQVIEVAYYPKVAIIAVRQDQSSIDFFAALDGGDGVWDYTIKDQSITTKQEAGERAVKELVEFSDPLVKGLFVTRTSQLTAGSIFKVGQSLTVNLATYGLNTDTTFLIQEVNIEMNEDSVNGRIEYIYTIRFGGRLTGVQEFLESLASASDETANATEIKTIELLNDIETTADSNLTYVKKTPPFHYTSGAPVGRYGLSEWS